MSTRTNRTRESDGPATDIPPPPLSRNTRHAYRMGWNRFAAHCMEHRRDPLDASPEDVAEFLVALGTEPRSPKATTGQGEPLALATIRIAVAAINWKYRERNRESPASHARVTQVLRGLTRRGGARQQQTKALREYEIADILSHCDRLAANDKHRVIATRDAALFAVGFAAALRRSEICALRREDVEFQHAPDGSPGMLLHIRQSKTDRDGRGQRIAVPEGARIRPVERLLGWLRLAGIERGPVFRTVRRGGHPQTRAISPPDVARLVKRYANRIGLDPAGYSGHSLRAGFVTSAAVHHARLDKIMEVTRHRSASTVLRYIRQADAFEDHAGAAFL